MLDTVSKDNMSEDEKLPTVLSEYLAKIGRKGGTSGRGKDKVRGDKAYYSALSAKGLAVRLANKKEKAES